MKVDCIIEGYSTDPFGRKKLTVKTEHGERFDIPWIGPTPEAFETKEVLTLEINLESK